MTFFLQRDDGQLARDLWGFPEAIISNDTRETIRVFPNDYETLCDTLALVPRLAGDPRCQDREVVLKNRSETTIVLRIQGYISQLKLGRLGDWDGDLKGCKAAANVLHLEAGNADYEEQWVCMWNTVRSLRRWVSAVSHSVCADRSQQSDMDTIRCARRAFVKVTQGVHPLSLDQNDPLYSAAERVQKMWTPERAIGFGIRRTDGRVTRTDPAIFSKGDFVDVAISFDVVKRDSGKVNVYLRLEHVIQLASTENQTAASIRALKGIDEEPTLQRLTSATIAFAEDDME